jgi:hypothetical protein
MSFWFTISMVLLVLLHLRQWSLHRWKYLCWENVLLWNETQSLLSLLFALSNELDRKFLLHPNRTLTSWWCAIQTDFLAVVSFEGLQERCVESPHSVSYMGVTNSQWKCGFVWLILLYPYSFCGRNARLKWARIAIPHMVWFSQWSDEINRWTNKLICIQLEGVARTNSSPHRMFSF